MNTPIQFNPTIRDKADRLRRAGLAPLDAWRYVIEQASVDVRKRDRDAE
jgi:hypothetical protein